MFVLVKMEFHFTELKSGESLKEISRTFTVFPTSSNSPLKLQKCFLVSGDPILSLKWGT